MFRKAATRHQPTGRRSAIGASLLAGLMMLIASCKSDGSTATPLAAPIPGVTTGFTTTGSTNVPSIAVPLGTGSTTGRGVSSTQLVRPVAPAVKVPKVLWTSNTPQPLGQPVAVGKDSLVLFTVTNTVPYIQVMAPDSGKIRWRRPASIGGDSPGKTIEPAVVRGRVVYFRPDDTDSYRGHLIIADTLTGKDLYVGKEDYWLSERPYECDGEVCFSGFLGEKVQSFRAEVPSGTTVVDKGRLLPGARVVGTAGLQGLKIDGQPEILARLVGGRTLWQYKITDLFGAGYTLNGGWQFFTYAKARVYVGMLGYQPGNKVPQRANLSHTMEMVGLDDATGKRRWLDQGADACLPQEVARNPTWQHAPVRCRWGRNSVLEKVGDSDILRTASVGLEGFDPVTGRTTWSVALADPTGLSYAKWNASLALAGRNALIAKGKDGPITVDPVTGRHTPALADTQPFCATYISGPIWGHAWTYLGRTYNIYYSGRAVSACTTDDKPIAAQSAWPSWAGIEIGDIRVVTTPQGLTASRLVLEGSAPGTTVVPTPQPRIATRTPTSNPAAKSLNPPTLAWTFTSAVPLTQPVAASKAIVLYTRGAEGLTLEGLDPVSGRSIWHRPASPGNDGPNDGIVPNIAGDRVVYLRDNGEVAHSARIVVADANTGADLSVSSGYFFVRDWLRPCGHDICFGTRDSSGWGTVRVDVATGLTAVEPPFDQSMQIPIGAGLIRTFKQDSSIIASTTGLITFQIPALSVVPADYSTLNTSFKLWPAAGAYVGEFIEAYDPGKVVTSVQLGRRSLMVAIDATTGKKLWSTTDANTGCLAWEFSQAQQRFPVRCRWGKNATEESVAGSTVFHSATVSVEGYDPKSGRTTWTVPLAARTAENQLIAYATAENTLLAPGPAGLVLIDLSTGKARPAPGSQGWYCRHDVSSPLGISRNLAGNIQDNWSTGTAYDWCDAAINPGTPPKAWPSWTGIQVGGMHVVLTSTGLSGFRQQ